MLIYRAPMTTERWARAKETVGWRGRGSLSLTRHVARSVGQRQQAAAGPGGDVFVLGWLSVRGTARRHAKES